MSSTCVNRQAILIWPQAFRVMFHVLCQPPSYSKLTPSFSCDVPCTVSAVELFYIDLKPFMWCPMYCVGRQVIRSWSQVFHVMSHVVSAAKLFEVDPKFFMWCSIYCVGRQVIRSWPQAFHVLSHVLCRPPSISYVDISFFRNVPYLIDIKCTQICFHPWELSTFLLMFNGDLENVFLINVKTLKTPISPFLALASLWVESPTSGMRSVPFPLLCGTRQWD